MNNLHKEVCQYIVFEKLSLNQYQIHLGYQLILSIGNAMFGLQCMILSV